MDSVQDKRYAGIPEGAYAGLMSRALAMLLDLALVSTALFVTESFLRLLGTYLPLARLVSRSSVWTSISDIAGATAASVIILLVAAGYPILSWTLAGSTVGKALFGLRVVRTDGSRLTLARSALRYVAYLVSIIPLGLGFLWPLVDERRQAWHDKIADTCVIYSWAHASQPTAHSSAHAAPQ